MRYLILALIAVFMIAMCVIYENCITRYRINMNQLAWDKYSKKLSDDEKENQYFEWCRQKKLEKGWEHYYFPKM